MDADKLKETQSLANKMLEEEILVMAVLKVGTRRSMAISKLAA